MYAASVEETLSPSTDAGGTLSLLEMLRRSLIIVNLHAAAKDSNLRYGILFGIYNLVAQITSQEDFYRKPGTYIDLQNTDPLFPNDGDRAKSESPGDSDGQALTNSRSSSKGSDEGSLPQSLSCNTPDTDLSSASVGSASNSLMINVRAGKGLNSAHTTKKSAENLGRHEPISLSMTFQWSVHLCVCRSNCSRSRSICAPHSRIGVMKLSKGQVYCVSLLLRHSELHTRATAEKAVVTEQLDSVPNSLEKRKLGLRRRMLAKLGFQSRATFT